MTFIPIVDTKAMAIRKLGDSDLNKHDLLAKNHKISPIENTINSSAMNAANSAMDTTRNTETLSRSNCLPKQSESLVPIDGLNHLKNVVQNYSGHHSPLDESTCP